MNKLKEHLVDLLAHWDSTYIRAKIGERWESPSLAELDEIGQGQDVIDWITSTRGRFWK